MLVSKKDVSFMCVVPGNQLQPLLDFNVLRGAKRNMLRASYGVVMEEDNKIVAALPVQMRGDGTAVLGAYSTHQVACDAHRNVLSQMLELFVGDLAGEPASANVAVRGDGSHLEEVNVYQQCGFAVEKTTDKNVRLRHASPRPWPA